MKIHDIRSKFIQFFEEKKHQYIPGAPIINREDPTLLFINAGMNPFKSIFLGEETPAFPRVANSQPCLRVTGKHNDLEEVGIDTYHHTFFEMLGTWSFGDYFKKEAIAWAWELLTQVYKLPKSQLYATVFEGSPTEGLEPDTESHALWKQYLPEEQIIYASKKDNFWEMGESGPCGPCTEIHVDIRSEEARKKTSGASLVNKDHPQVVEIWNLVFMQYNRQADQTLKPLPQQHVDTGMGLERLAMVLQGKQATYDTDAFTPLIQWLEKSTNQRYNENEVTDRAIRVIVDHIRAIAFTIADGQLPGTQKAGYVIRRILRRALRYGYSYLGLQQPFLYQMIPTLIAEMGPFYPTLQKQADLLQKTIRQEEETFLGTLKSGLKKFDYLIAQLPDTQKEIAGNTVFELYDTYGFPPDLTRLIAQEAGYTIDEKGFEASMQQQKLRSKDATTRKVGDWHTLNSNPTVEFVGYDTLSIDTTLLKYRTLTNAQGTFYQLVLAKTPFYAEGGGQVGDTGWLAYKDEKIAILDTQRENNLIVHYTKELPTDVKATCRASVDAERRKRITRNHSATHLVQAALQQVLGNHIQQKGSLVQEGGFRFDFTHTGKLLATQLTEVSKIVNKAIRKNIALEEHRSMPIEQAKKMGAMALFGEKYGQQVRVVIFDPTFSVELCGGTHVQATGEIGRCQILTETSIAAGVRRIEVITGDAVDTWIEQQQHQLATIQQLVKTSKDPVKGVSQLIESHRALQKKHDILLEQQLVATLKELLTKEMTKGTMKGIVEAIEVPNVDFLKKLGRNLSKKATHHLVVLTSIIANKPYLLVVVDSALTARWHAHEIVQTLAPYIQGKGGGKATFALAGGQDTTRIQSLLIKAREIFRI